MVRLLPLLERELDGADQPDVFVNCNTEGEDVLLRLPFVELLDADLQVGEGFEWRGEGLGELNG